VAETRARTRTDQAALERVRDLHARLARESGIALPVRLWDGTDLGDTDADFRVVLHHPWSLRAMLLPPTDLAAGEAYVEGDIDVEGDIVTALAQGRRLAERMPGGKTRVEVARGLIGLPRPPRRPHHRRARLRGRPHSPARDRAAIQFHYDLPVDFYRAFLDDSLTYSCAYFLDAGERLETAQRRKHDVLCRKLRLRPGMRLLDIGCGFGSLLVHAARRYGVSGIGVTLSETQAETGRERLAAEGLDHLIEIRLADYRDLDEHFDAVVSVGMFEHVGPRNLADYFATAHRLTKPGGMFCNHGIVTGQASRQRTGRERDFASRYVFPDGGLVPAWQALREAQRPGFQLLDVEQLRPSYALTLRDWVRRLERNRTHATAITSEADYRIWRVYMAGSALAFEDGMLGVIQILCQKPGGAAPPLGREWMLPEA
jgi:cyclopropane-fatty-acyl-phospholipid synthase